MDRFIEINKGLPLIPRNIPLVKQLIMAEKKLEFMKDNTHLFISTGEYMITLGSVKKEIEDLENKLKEDTEVKE